MNKFTTVLATVAAIFLFGIGGVVSAQQAVNPGGPWVTPAQDELGHVSLEAFMTYEELSQTLTRIETNSKSRVRIDTIATSAAGREVWVAKIGDPANPAVMVINQQHGDEPHGAEAAVDIIKSLGNGSARSDAILDELFVVIVPRMNVNSDNTLNDKTEPSPNNQIDPPTIIAA